MTLPPGTRLSGYSIVEPIGVGGMGEVYRARDTRLGRDVALKLLPDGFSDDQDSVRRLVREAQLLASVNHPAIATLYGFEEDGDAGFLVMELVEGDTLEERIARGPIELPNALRLFIQIAEGIEAAHRRGVVHRDLKPANIKVLGDGRVKILDFGVAKALAPDVQEGPADGRPRPWDVAPAPSDPADSTPLGGFPFARLSPRTLPPRMTQTGELVGTPAYMSPEQAFGDPIGVPADIWGFGCCLFEALSGTSPFQGKAFPQLATAILVGQPDWARLDHLPGGIRDLLYQCLAKDPHDRPETARRVIELLRSAISEAGASGARGGRPPATLENRLFEMSEDMLCVAGLDGFLKRVNPAFERILGWSASELYSRPFIEFVHEDDRQATLQQFVQITEGIPARSFGNRYRCADGEYRQLYWTGVLDPETRLVYGVARFEAPEDD